MDQNVLQYHIDKIKSSESNTHGFLLDIPCQDLNKRLDHYYGRGFTNKRWDIIINGFIDRIHKTPSFTSHMDTNKYFFSLGHPIMKDAVKYFYEHGSYPIDGIVDYNAYRKKVQFEDWFYNAF